MNIDSIKNNLNIVLHSTIDLTRSKVKRIAKFIFQSSFALLRCIRDNPSITFASSFVIVLAGLELHSPALIIIGVVLPILNAVLTVLEHSASKSIDLLLRRINTLQSQINREQRGYDQLVAENASQEDLSAFQSCLNALINQNTTKIEDCQRKINRLEVFRNG